MASRGAQDEPKPLDQATLFSLLIVRDIPTFRFKDILAFRFRTGVMATRVALPKLLDVATLPNMGGIVARGAQVQAPSSSMNIPI